MDLSTTEWHGENPFFLMVVGIEYDGQHAKIDLDEPQWATIYADYMRMPGEWHLCRKDNNVVALSLMIHIDDQPYYTSRVFGSTTSGGRLVRAYGIGKKQADDSMVRLWVLENGLTCGGDDVDEFGPKVLNMG
jgi:hypothetical protein